MTQTVTLTGLGALAAVALFLLARTVLVWWRPAFPVELTPQRSPKLLSRPRR